MTRPTLYAFDIDGTILTSNNQILPSTKEGVALLKEKGDSILLASARPPRAIAPIADQLELEHLYVCFNGALVVRGKKVLFEDPMNTAITQEVIKRAVGKNLSINVYSSWDWLIKETNQWSTAEGNVVGYHGKVADLSKVTQAHKILIIGEIEEILKLQAELWEAVPEVSATRSFPHYLEVVTNKASKAHALEVVSTLLGFSTEDIVAFGDGENDLPMLKLAGYGVAMGNAHAALKEEADFVTTSNDEDGIWNGIQTILGLGGVR